MLRSVLARFVKTFAGGILRTTGERWVDGVALVATSLYQFFIGKRSTFWEGVEPFVWLVCFICVVHVLRATWKVWTEISEQPTVREVESPILLPDARKRSTLVVELRPPYFRAKLLGILLVSLTVLSLLAYLVRGAAVASVRTYIYLVPTAELMECQKRAFFIKTVGPQVLYNVEIVLKDNKSGQTYPQTYPEIDPGQRSSDSYFWFAPSSRWDEDYTATISTRELHSSQRLIVRSTQHQFQSAMEVLIDDEKSPYCAAETNHFLSHTL